MANVSVYDYVYDTYYTYKGVPIEDSNFIKWSIQAVDIIENTEQKPATYSDKVKKYANSGLEYIAIGLEAVVCSPAFLLCGVIPGFGIIFF